MPHFLFSGWEWLCS